MKHKELFYPFLFLLLFTARIGETFFLTVGPSSSFMGTIESKVENSLFLTDSVENSTKPSTLPESWLKLDPGDKSVAILDTGIKLGHSMFNEEQLLYWKDFVGSSIDEENDLYSEPTDVNGHGYTYYGIKPDLLAHGGTLNYQLDYIMIADNNNTHDVIPMVSTDLACAYISAVALSMTNGSWDYTWSSVAKVKQIILLNTYESSGTENSLYPDPTKDYFGKDNVEGWGIYQYGLPIKLAIENIGETINFQTVLDRYNGDAVRVYELHTREEYNYTINIETNATAVVAIVSEQTTEDGDLIVEDVSLTTYLKKTLNLFGYGEKKYLVFRSYNEDQAITITGSVISSRQSWAKVRSTNIREFMTDRFFYLNISYGNGFPHLLLNGVDITSAAQVSRYFFSYEGLELGTYLLEFTVKSANASWSAEWQYSLTWHFTILKEKQPFTDGPFFPLLLTGSIFVIFGAVLLVLLRRRGAG